MHSKSENLIQMFFITFSSSFQLDSCLLSYFHSSYSHPSVVKMMRRGRRGEKKEKKDKKSTILGTVIPLDQIMKHNQCTFPFSLSFSFSPSLSHSSFYLSLSLSFFHSLVTHILFDTVKSMIQFEGSNFNSWKPNHQRSVFPSTNRRSIVIPDPKSSPPQIFSPLL